jgi:hypothetical protein
VSDIAGGSVVLYLILNSSEAGDDRLAPNVDVLADDVKRGIRVEEQRELRQPSAASEVGVLGKQFTDLFSGHNLPRLHGMCLLREARQGTLEIRVIRGR